MSRLGGPWLRGVLCLALALSLQTAVNGAASADGGWHRQRGGYFYGHGHYQHRKFRHHRHYHHGGSDAAAWAAIVLGGLVVGTLLAQSWADAPPAAAPAVPTGTAPLRLGNCKPTTGRELIDGRWALMSGTWCTDQYGRGYILSDSIRFVRYLD